MHRKPLGDTPCPIARTVARIGEGWSVLILREAFYGVTRFDDFQKNLGIAPNMLTRRLNFLVGEGVLERRPYCDHPPRSEYVLTQRGHEFRPVLLAMLAWGNKHFAPEGESVLLVDRRTGASVSPVLVDAANGHPITEADHLMAAGPAASEGMHRRLARSAGASAEAQIQTVPAAGES
ncbi:winged helix-turn-helix transcriptional regulator [Cupriavidus sp. IDO]|uniref:winged helix-turn-helix transcriptional regulator n=1 Tax=Cupriavidus sp. IDO TaxID=1539142 RepID=UPI000579586D|nr:helix-turn-helix domain-containing protein [Cupriavidus sp. IDO]KWR91748.1 HxlR family transcriptional regulator [Cupriavidus sp. IDO]